MKFACLPILICASLWLAPPPPASAEPITPRTPVEVTTGRGFIAPLRAVMSGDNNLIRDTNWIDFKIRPWPEIASWEAFSLQLGAHQSSDFTKAYLCGRIPSIAGRIYCSSAEADRQRGSQLSAYYGGIQAELIELSTRQPRSTLVLIGLGGSTIQTVTQNRKALPYSSVEASYRFTPRFEARAGMFFGLEEAAFGYGMSTPNLTIEYRF